MCILLLDICTMICALPMYPFPRDSLDKFWSALRGELLTRGCDDVPLALDNPGDLLAHWRRPDLLLSQSCGYPVSTLLKDQVRVVGAFHFDVPGCTQHLYSSVLMVHKDNAGKSLQDLRGGVAVCNERHSQSGYHALRSAIAPFAGDGRFFSAVTFSGAHRDSARLVAEGKADIAALDCVSAFFLRQQAPQVFEQLAAIAYTTSLPGLPLVTSTSTSDSTLAALRSALAAVAQKPALAGPLRIAGFSPLSADDYRICAATAQQLRGNGMAEW